MAQLGLTPPASQGQNRPNMPGSGVFTYPQPPAGASQVFAPLSGGYYNQMAQQMAGPRYLTPPFKFDLSATGANGPPGLFGGGMSGPQGPGGVGPYLGSGSLLSPGSIGSLDIGSNGGNGGALDPGLSSIGQLGTGNTWGSNLYGPDISNPFSGFNISPSVGALGGSLIAGPLGGLVGGLLGHLSGGMANLSPSEKQAISSLQQIDATTPIQSSQPNSYGTNVQVGTNLGGGWVMGNGGNMIGPGGGTMMLANGDVVGSGSPGIFSGFSGIPGPGASDLVNFLAAHGG